MRLRSQHRVEFEALRHVLAELGLYENDMELDEMRELMDAWQKSVSEEEATTLNQDIELAVKASELDFAPSNSSSLNTTMHGASDRGAHVSDSDDENDRNCICNASPNRIVVVAQVHHELDWSPSILNDKKAASPPFHIVVSELERSQRKRRALLSCMQSDSSSFDSDEGECVPKRRRHSSKETTDSGVSGVEDNASVSISDNSFNDTELATNIAADALLTSVASDGNE